MKISIIGAGCVGTVFAERLYLDNQDVSFIATGDRAKTIIENGIIVNGNTYKIPITKSKADLIIVCVKNFDLEQACNDIKEYVRDDTIILPLLNSISPTPTIKKFFPNNRVLYAYITKIDSYKDDNGYKYNIAGDIHFGYSNNENIKPELKNLANIFNNAGFNAFIDDDMIRGVWKKWMLNVGANQVSALTEADYLQFAKIPEIEQVLRLAMQELLTIACYENVNLSTKDITEIIEYLTTYPFPKKTSMLQDVLAHRKTEIDFISGDIITLSKKWNCPCPVNLTMYYLIKSKEKAYNK